MASVLRTGVDLVEIDRIQQAIERYGSRFLSRIFTPIELTEAGNSMASLAARYAAKEAVAKAFCTGIGPMNFTDIEIRKGERGAPTLVLYRAAQKMAEKQGLNTWSVSLSHTKTHAIALVVAVG